MAAHDTHKPAGGSPFDLDEDLFNFPVIELGPEGLRDPAAVAAAEAEAAKAEAAKAAATAPPAPLPSAASAGSSEKTLGASTPSILPVTPVSTAPKSNSESKESKTAAPVAPVAEMGGAKWRVLVAALVGLFLLNGGVFFYLYRSSSTFGAGIEDLRAELGDATVRLDRARDEIKERGNAETFTSPYAVGETIDALERQAVAMAETEIATGDYGAARRRLYRLLAQADRMPASLRAELEPRASYLIARSYHVESEKRAEVSR